MRVQLTLSTPTTRWNCMFTYSKSLTWNALKFSTTVLRFIVLYVLYSLFLFVSVFYTFVWLLKLCTILGSLVCTIFQDNIADCRWQSFFMVHHIWSRVSFQWKMCVHIYWFCDLAFISRCLLFGRKGCHKTIWVEVTRCFVWWNTEQ